MKSILTTITLSISAFIATSAIAAPNDAYWRDKNHYAQNQWNHHHHQRWNNTRYERYDRYDNRIRPSREWRSGQVLPNQFNSSRYHVDYRNYRHLPRPDKYHQWYRVNGDYVLVNQKNNRIIRVIG